MKAYWRFYLFKWHSINLVPHISLTSTCDDDNYDLIIGRHLQLTILGWVINLGWPSRKPKRHYFSEVRGPLYSRRRKCWYRVLDEEHNR